MSIIYYNFFKKILIYITKIYKIYILKRYKIFKVKYPHYDFRNKVNALNVHLNFIFLYYS